MMVINDKDSYTRRTVNSDLVEKVLKADSVLLLKSVKLINILPIVTKQSLIESLAITEGISY